jgi:hypothetical protein
MAMIGFVRYTFDEHFQQDNIKFAFESENTCDPKNYEQSHFYLYEENREDDINGLLFTVGKSDNITIKPFTDEDYVANGYDDRDGYYFYSWKDLWDQYRVWCEYLESMDETD